MTSILTEAESIVNGPEQQNRKYGPPEQVFQCYADIFNRIAPTNVELTSVDVAYVILSIKLGREAFHHKRDNLVDACGYLEIISKIVSSTNNTELLKHEDTSAKDTTNTGVN